MCNEGFSSEALVFMHAFPALPSLHAPLYPRSLIHKAALAYSSILINFKQLFRQDALFLPP
jgi:hypothetical protein